MISTNTNRFHFQISILWAATLTLICVYESPAQNQIDINSAIAKKKEIQKAGNRKRAVSSCDSLLYITISNNRGEGKYRLQGVRNLRAVLPGLLYRSGGNNLYHPLTSRHNYNPLSFQSVLNLWEIGFDEIIYLYNFRYDSLYTGELNGYLNELGMKYTATVPVKESQVRAILRKVHAMARSDRSGYLLIHCWNGWHMSGLISAYALMQFCSYDVDEAWSYWKYCTEGNFKGYEKLRDRLQAFKPYPELILTAEQKKLYCPCEKK